MASEEFYTWMIIATVVSLMLGGAMAFSGANSPPAITGIGIVIFFVGILIGLVLAGAFFFDAKKRVKGWNVEKRYDDLETKEKEINLKRREQEIREQEEQLKQEDAKRRQQKQSEKAMPMPDHRKNEYSEQATPMPDKRQNKDAIQRNQPKKEEQKSDLLESPKKKDRDNDNYILKTGEKVPDSLKQKHTLDLPEESVFTDIDYAKAISDSIPLKALWKIYKEPDKYRNTNQLYESFDEEFDRRTDLYAIFKKEEFRKLVSIPKEKTDGFMLVPLGARLIKTARTEKIFNWNAFAKRFEPEF